MTGLSPALLQLLSGGGSFSLRELASRLGVSETALAQLLTDLRDQGLDVDSASEAGRVLAGKFELLDAAQIQDALPPDTRALLQSLEVHACIDSTNTYLLAQAPPAAGEARACLAEWQSHGRGRRGRRWIAPLGGSLCLSLGWCFAHGRDEISALGLASGVAVARALARMGVADVGLKWPNDLVWNDSKLGGLLAESSRKADGSVYVVTGLGLNIDLGAARERIEPVANMMPTDLRCCGPGRLPGRNRLAAALLDELLRAMREFQQQGFAPFQGPWAELDRLRGRQVTVFAGQTTVVGSAEGVDGAGALLLRVDGQQQRFFSGETTVRPGNASVD
jgi:BirA family biotin operon repressor/biotin-[acetyl-CoA-carboxylase] ligase